MISTSSNAGYAIYGIDDQDALEEFLVDYGGLDNYIRDLYSGPALDPSSSAAAVYVSSDNELLSESDFDFEYSYKNVVVFTGLFDNTECSLVVPYNSYSSLSVINGNLVNIGLDTVQGRVLYGSDVLDPNNYDSYVYNLQPVYGSTSNVYSRGSFNFLRHYYEDTSDYRDRISYTDTYGNFSVLDTDIYFSSSERSYYLELIIIFLILGVILCLRKMRF